MPEKGYSGKIIIKRILVRRSTNCGYRNIYYLYLLAVFVINVWKSRLNMTILNTGFGLI